LTTWNQRGRNTTAARNPNDARKNAATEIVNERIRNSSSGTIGSRHATRRPEHQPMIAPSTMSPPTVGSVQSAPCLLVSPIRMGTSAAVNNAAPM
jgi:hypothetical protein